MTTPTIQPNTLLLSKLTSVKHILCVLSGKGGVGKSSVSVQLALSLLASNPSLKIGLLDIDLTGPSLPRMLGLEGQDVHSSKEGWVPVYLDAQTSSSTEGGKEKGVLACMSIGFLLKNSRDSVVWRGPKKNAMIKQFLGEVRWGELDYLIVDTPPGTSDEHISLLENLRPLLIPHAASLSLPTLSCLLVTTPQAVALLDVSKELSFIRRTEIPLLGLIENMSGYVCPHCSDIVGIFGLGGGENFCKLEEERKDSLVEGEGGGCRFLGRIPIDRELVGLLDGSEVVKVVSEVEALNSSTSIVAGGEKGKAISLSGLELDSTISTSSTSTTKKKTLVERYTTIPSFTIIKVITDSVVELIAEQEEKEKKVRLDLGLN